jgi:hypothetical protein
MMATTHAFVGAALASVTVFVAPAAAPAAMAAGFLGGLAPDLDLLGVHRQDLHFPMLAWIPAGCVLVLAVLFPATGTIAIAAFLLAFAVHPVMDVFGGSSEPEPWKRTTEVAVYNHHRGQWHTARRWVRYDGSPEDLGVASLASLPMLVFGTAPIADLATAALALSIAYTLARKRILTIYAALVGRLPSGVAARLPARKSPTEHE